jgi:hypothetical protein
MSTMRAVLTLLLMLLMTYAALAQTRPLSISGFPAAPKEWRRILGSHWYVYVDGEIDGDAGKRLDAFIEAEGVPYTSTVILNSPGGSLVGGMELGRVIRKHNLSTNVGVQKVDGTGARSYEPGVCMSACTLAYLGGRFRFLSGGSRYGVHRFYFSTSIVQEADVAQVLSAMVVNYLKEMDIDTELFALTTTAGRTEIVEPTRPKLEALRVVNNGFTEPKWTVEGGSFLYLKGERDTVYGVNKFILLCDRGAVVQLHIIFDPQGREEEVMGFRAHSLVIDGKDEPISPAGKSIQNGWFNAHYRLSSKQVRAVRSATSVGLIVRGSYEAPIFLGFNNMRFQEASSKLQGLLNTCGYAR